MAKHNKLGFDGEDIAVDYLLSKGYVIHERNWRYGRLEIDIIASDLYFLVFIEVKSRSSNYWGNPEEAVSKAKIKRIIEATDFYLQNQEKEYNTRFDVISILLKDNKVDIVHIEDAFFPPINL